MPADEHDALPFEGQSAHRGGMGFTSIKLVLDKCFRPGSGGPIGWRIQRSSDGGSAGGLNALW